MAPTTMKKRSAPKPQKKGTIVKRRRLYGPALNPIDHYRVALTDPLNPEAAGARIPDQYSGHTETCQIKASLTLNNSGTTSNVVILPSIALPAFTSLANGIAGGSATIYADGTTVLSSRFADHSAAMNGLLDTYRIVGMGARITGVASMTNSAGKVAIATFPINSSAYFQVFTVGGITPRVDASVTPTATLFAMGIPSTAGAVDFDKVVSLPGSQVISMVELAEREFDIVPKLTDPRAFEFRTVVDKQTGFQAVSQTSAAFISSGDASYLALNGFEAIVIAAEGLTAGAGPISVDIIYHLEGKPNVNGATTIVCPTSVSSPVDINGLWRVVQDAASLPSVREALTIGANMIHPMIGQLAGRLLR